jgi:hypothetical protein
MNGRDFMNPISNAGHRFYDERPRINHTEPLCCLKNRPAAWPPSHMAAPLRPRGCSCRLILRPMFWGARRSKRRGEQADSHRLVHEAWEGVQIGMRRRAPSLLQFGWWWRPPVVLQSRGGARQSHCTLVKVLVQEEKLGKWWLGAAAMGLELCSCDGKKLPGGA